MRKLKGVEERMLTMTQIKRIKKMYYSKGKNISKISKATGHNYRTIIKYLEKNDYNNEAEIKKEEKRGRPRKIDPVMPIIEEWLMMDKTAPVKQRHTAKRIYDRLKKEHPELLDVSYRTISSYVSKKKAEIYGSQEGYIPLTHPGGEAQVDFGQALFYEKGKALKGHYLSMSFPYSNAGYTQVFKGENQECLLEGMKRIFEHIEKVPNKIWFDNLSAAVILGKNKERTLVDQFERFSLHYGFEINWCNPNSGHEKGGVENKVGYTRRNMFVPIPEFDDINEYNKELLKLGDEDNQRPHYLKNKNLSELLAEEKKYMFSLPNNEFEIGRIKSAITNKYGKIEFETNTYSVSPAYMNKEIIIKATADKIKIMDKDYNEIISHSRIYDKNKESMKWYPYLLVLAKRPTAIKYTGFFNELPDIWKNYINQQEKEEKKKTIKALMKMIDKDNENQFENATIAIKEAMKNNVTDIDSIITTYYCLKNKERLAINAISEINEINIKENIPKIEPYVSDIKVYDSLYKKQVMAI